MSLHRHIIVSPTPQWTLGFALGVVHSVFREMHNNAIITCVHYYSVTQDSSMALKILCPVCSFLPCPQPLATTDTFIVSLIVAVPECGKIRTIQHAAFSDATLYFSFFNHFFPRTLAILGNHTVGIACRVST